MAHPSKGGAAKLKAYVASARRASAGEAHPVLHLGAGQRRLKVRDRAIWLLSCRSF